MGKNEFIELIVVRKAETLTNNLNRKDFFELMDSIRKNYINNNEISSRFVSIIPKVKSMYINEDRNREMDTPFIGIEMIDGSRTTISIPRYHKIIWGILDEFSK
ncbi:MAG: hypothetical protein IKF97_01255 [Clostridia bacterium]|nr:hypothetical protein [Clostridia bacterium]